MEGSFKLNEKTAILHGPLTPTLQSTANQLTEQGADVALVTEDEQQAQRYVNNLMDLREVHTHRGRAAAINTSSHEAKECISRAAELFGSVDIFVDAQFTEFSQDFLADKALEQIDNILEKSFQKTIKMTHAVTQFLVGRKKGRIIFLLNEGPQIGLPHQAINSLGRTSFKDFSKRLAMDVLDSQTTVNCISMGLTEEFLLRRFPKAENVHSSREKINDSLPHNKLLDSMEIANLITFLASPLSSGITGQTIHITHGL